MIESEEKTIELIKIAFASKPNEARAAAVDLSVAVEMDGKNQFAKQIRRTIRDVDGMKLSGSDRYEFPDTAPSELG